MAAGVEAAGGKAIVVPGVAADMKLGDVMNAEQADLGISFVVAAAQALLPLKLNMVTKLVMGCVLSKRERPPLRMVATY